jgi:hypothetical protein
MMKYFLISLDGGHIWAGLFTLFGSSALSSSVVVIKLGVRSEDGHATVDDDDDSDEDEDEDIPVEVAGADSQAGAAPEDGEVAVEV